MTSDGSILDTDLYKLTMQQAVLEHFPTAAVKYKFKNRSKETMPFSIACFEHFKTAVSRFSNRFLTEEEATWMKTSCPFFKPAYISYLEEFRFRPDEQVSIAFVPNDSDPEWGQIEIDVHGLWVETILYEVPLMAALSEAYFTTVDTDWSLDGQEELAYQKGMRLLKGGVMLSEFGTRRRRSLETHRLVMEGLMRAHKELEGDPEVKGQLKGTSNVHFTRLLGTAPIGTIAHEWTMGIAALHGYSNSNLYALSLWEEIYPLSTPSNLSMYIALTDTFRSSTFFKEFASSPQVAERWKGLRQDSGDPFEFAREAKKVYEGLGISVADKVLVFSDGLNVEKTLEIQKANQEEFGFQASFGVGTTLTNDFKSLSSGNKSKALNIVIKISEIEGKPCIKLSDDLGKNMGNTDTIAAVKKELGLE